MEKGRRGGKDSREMEEQAGSNEGGFISAEVLGSDDGAVMKRAAWAFGSHLYLPPNLRL